MAAVKLRHIEIDYFRSIKELSFEFPENNLLILVGHNNAGKSNIIRAIDFICGESWKKADTLEDHDFYLRDRKYDVRIKLTFDNGHLGSFSSKEGWAKYTSHEGKKVWDDTAKSWVSAKEVYPCTYLAADRTLDKHISFYDYTLIGRIRREFHRRAADQTDAIKAKYQEISDIYDQVDGFKKFKSDFSSFFDEMQADSPAKLSLDFKPFTPSNYFKNMQILAQDPSQLEQMLDLSELGEGSRNTVLLALLRSYAENFKNASGILALEEPELFLHPQARRHLFKTLQKIARTGMQVIISTHSSSFLDTEFFDSIGQVFKVPDEEIKGKTHTQLRLVKKQELVDFCIATGVPKQKVNADSIVEYYKTSSNVRANEGFFARLIILVEGDTEELALPEYLEQVGLDIDLQGISIISVCGKNQIPKFWRLFAQFNAPIIIMFDNDNTSEKTQSNNNVANCFGVSLDSILHNHSIYAKLPAGSSPCSSMYILNQDFETAIKNDLKDDELYEKLESEAKSIIKPIGNQNKGQISRYIARQLRVQKPEYIPSFILELSQEIRDCLGIEKPSSGESVGASVFD